MNLRHSHPAFVLSGMPRSWIDGPIRLIRLRARSCSPHTTDGTASLQSSVHAALSVFGPLDAPIVLVLACTMGETRKATIVQKAFKSHSCRVLRQVDPLHFLVVHIDCKVGIVPCNVRHRHPLKVQRRQIAYEGFDLGKPIQASAGARVYDRFCVGRPADHSDSDESPRH